MTALVSIRNISVHYRDAVKNVEALAGANLDIDQGERLAIIGESGSGKSTFALALAGLLPSSAMMEGVIAWPSLGHFPKPGRDIGFVFQDPSASLDPVLTIGEQIAEVARAHLGLTWRQSYRLALDLLARVHIPDPHATLHAFPHQLSGGQRQRVAIAAAIAARPRILIADEATSALDTIVQAEIVALLDRLTREDGMSLVFITHDIALASQLAERLAVFYAARLVEAGDAADLLSAPRHPYTQALIDAHIDLGQDPHRRLPVIPGNPPDLTHPPSGCRFAQRCRFANARCDIDPFWRGAIGDGAACVLLDEKDLAA
ncbi:ABC transporter ATP-binding protein [Microvirga sp. 2MCAF38]|uniref:ABC transporter ATP-binding protein n=1 Tax=Microvirga sp. 2MCAF38 TaxID=3232989 RepID=UPI003F996C9B